MTAGRERLALVLLLLVVAGLALPGLLGEALDWDDVVWLEDPVRTLPLADAVRTAFGSTRDHVYAPLLRLSFRLLGPPLLIHAATLLAWLLSIAGIHTLLRRLDVPAIPAWVAVAIWALHPSKVECHAWVTGLKDVQSLVLLVGAALALMPDDRPSVGLGTLSGTAALLTKAAVFPVPFVLAAIVAGRSGRAEAVRRFGPLCVVALVLAAVGGAEWAPHGWPDFGRAWVPLWVHGSFWLRLVPSMPSAIVALPADPRPVALLGLALTAISAVLARRWPTIGGPALLLWIGPQLPFLGLVPMAFWASDRHLLVPTLGPALALALAADRLSLAPLGKLAPLVIAVVSVPLLARRVGEWHDSLGFWQAEVERPGAHWVRWHKLGVASGRAGRFREAEAAFDRALVLRPADRETLAHRIVASLAADGWTRNDAALVPFLEPPPVTDAAWRATIEALRQAGESGLADLAERGIREGSR